jgi:hypothetical protein
MALSSSDWLFMYLHLADGAVLGEPDSLNACHCREVALNEMRLVKKNLFFVLDNHWPRSCSIRYRDALRSAYKCELRRAIGLDRSCPKGRLRYRAPIQRRCLWLPVVEGERLDWSSGAGMRRQWKVHWDCPRCGTMGWEDWSWRRPLVDIYSGNCRCFRFCVVRIKIGRRYSVSASRILPFPYRYLRHD